MTNTKEEIFWLDKFEGEAKGGYFVRNPLIEMFEKFEKNGLKIVGIKRPFDYNMELICVELGGQA